MRNRDVARHFRLADLQIAAEARVHLESAGTAPTGLRGGGNDCTKLRDDLSEAAQSPGVQVLGAAVRSLA